MRYINLAGRYKILDKSTKQDHLKSIQMRYTICLLTYLMH